MRVEFHKATKFGAAKVGTIHYHEGKNTISASATPGHALLMRRLALEPVRDENMEVVDPKTNPQVWVEALEHHYNGTYLRANVMPETFEEQEHWVTLPGGRHVLVGGQSEHVKRTLAMLPHMRDMDKDSLKYLYERDPEFREFADAIHAYTDGHNKPITAAAERFVKEGEAGLAKLKTEPPFAGKRFEVQEDKPITGGKLEPKTPENMMHYGLILNHAIANAPEEEKTVWRGASADKPIPDFEAIKPGSEFLLTGPRSFSHDPKVALSYIEPTADHKYLFVLEGKSKGIEAKTISASPELNEFITGGRFKVKSVEDSQMHVAGGHVRSNVKTFHLEQTGVFDAH